MRNGLVSYEERGRVGWLTLSNPPMNILTAEMRRDFLGTLDEVREESEIRALVITGEGKRAFCAGADLKEEEELTASTVRNFLDEDRLLPEGLEGLPYPVIAAINGYCMGGGFELALACDIRLVAEEAKLCAAGVKVGVVVSTARLTKLFGPALAKDLILTGRVFSGAEAERRGVASKCVPRERLMEEASWWADQIASRAPLAVGQSKRAIWEAIELPFEEAIEKELDYFAALSATQDHKRAIAAFFNKEQPTFVGE